MTRILVCGGREFDDWALLDKALSEIVPKWCDGTPTVIIEGEAKGADFLARVWAKYKGLKYEPYPADWKKYGYGAGPIRNQQMLDEGKPDRVVAFKGDTGTKDMIARAERANIPVDKYE